jgi:HEAT repeat protein
MRKAWVVWIALAVIAAAIGTYAFLSPEHNGARRLIGRVTRAMGKLVGSERRAKKPIEVILREIEHGNEVQRTQAIVLLRYDLAEADFAKVFPYLIAAMKDQSEMVRNAAASVVGDLSRHFSREAAAAETALTVLLDDKSPAIRDRAVLSLGNVAASGNLDTPPPRLVACLDDELAQVRISAIKALIEYGNGPELIVPAALRRMPTENPDVGAAFEDLFWHVRLEPSVLPLLIEGLSSESTDVRRCCTAAINHMGRDARPALPAILTLIRKELAASRPPGVDFGHSRIIGMAAGAIGELTPDTDAPPGSVELLCEILKRGSAAGRESGIDRPPSPGPSAKTMDDATEFVLAEAVWSLGIFGRSAAAAVPLLLSTFESSLRTSDHLAGLTAESLAEISRGAPDEDRVLASLAKGWKTAPENQKAGIARALRRLGPKSEQLVIELKHLPPDEMGSQIRPVRYPRSRRDAPVRE